VAHLSTDRPDAQTRLDILQLAERIEAEDGAPPLSDQTLTQLRAGGVEHFVARREGSVVGYAQRDGGGAEVAAEPDVLADLLDAVTTDGLLVWSHGLRSRLATVIGARGFVLVRELHQLRRRLEGLPADPPLAADVEIRAFEPGPDDDAWLALNAAAFAAHAEQGSWTHDDLQARIDAPWFDAAGFLLAQRAGELVGFHWTKVHPDGTGEVYVLGISSAAQGLGLGQALLVRGLRHLADRGCREALLYVDGDNPNALRLYERAGFTPTDVDKQWKRA
jgi:mycothiol synthase